MTVNENLCVITKTAGNTSASVFEQTMCSLQVFIWTVKPCNSILW